MIEDASRDLVAAENEVRGLMRSTQCKYFPTLASCVFQIEQRPDLDGVVDMRVVFGVPVKITLYYGDPRVLDPRYRMGLVPVIAHELAHLIDPVDPERVMAERLPEPMVLLWAGLREAGLAKCSMDVPD